MTRPSRLEMWPVAYDPASELDWGDPVISGRLLREHLDARHDSASRRPHLIARHVRRLNRLLPKPSARVLDAACGPGLYAVALAANGHRVVGVDVGPEVIRHARRLAREHAVTTTCAFEQADLATLDMNAEFDAAILIYHVLESFPRVEQSHVLSRLAEALVPRGRLIVEMRTRADHPDGRLSSWDVADQSLLSERRHLLLSDSVYDSATLTHVLRETAVFDDGTTASQQTSSQFTPLHRLDGLFRRGGLQITAVYDGWTTQQADADSASLLVVATPR